MVTDGIARDADGVPLKLKSNHQCRLCGRWLEGEWNQTTDQAERDRIQAEMDHGRCGPGRCRKPGEHA